MSDPNRIYNVLFLCTGNSCRSIMAEAIMNRVGRGKFKAYSAGSFPKGEVNPHALDMLRKFNFDPSRFRSKSWDEFTREKNPDAPPLDFVFTLCDDAAGEVCPIWPGQPMTAHWGMPDPALASGTEAEIGLAFADTWRMLSNRINIFMNLPFAKLDKLSLQRRLEAIGEARAEEAPPTAVRNVLFLCTGNSARSVMAEALMNKLGAGRVRAYSAGSHPTGAVNPNTYPILQRLGFNPAHFRSKSWDEFAGAGAPSFDVIITVCDDAAGEMCPVWPGQPVSGHWGIPDPARAMGTPAQIAAAFDEAAGRLRARIEAFLALPLDSLDAGELKARLREIGETADKADA